MNRRDSDDAQPIGDARLSPEASSPPEGHGLWAITSYFNPAGYRSRLGNYRVFRERLGVPLVTVELSYGPAPELGAGDADVLVQIRGRDVLWQKERLLNVALEALPPSCRKVAWVDCDIIFERADWALAASRRLDQVPLVQAFQERYDLPPRTLPEHVRSRSTWFMGHSVAHKLAHGLVAPEILGETGTVHRWGCSLGRAWAARRHLLEAHGLYEAGVLGGGDRAVVCAAFAQFDGLRRPWQANRRQSEHFAAWAHAFHGDVRGEVGYIEGAIFHLWHGDKHHRRHVERYQGFRRFAFDPFEDVAIEAAGCWRWNTDKPEMHRYVSDYFHGRREDG